MKQIKLSQGKLALVDDEDYENLSTYRWCTKECNGRFYAVRRMPKVGTLIRMHREIIDAPKGTEVDHINGNSLDNRKINLRLCEHKQNLRNQKISKLNSSGYKGVSWNKQNNKWQAYIKCDQKRIHLGYFKVLEDAALAYNNAAMQHFGEFAKLNLI